MRIVVVRHASRQDKLDPEWPNYSPTPYDPPLSTDGFAQADSAGAKIAALLNHLDAIKSASQCPAGTLGARFQESNVVIHSSPFLRCVQTAQYIAKHVKCERIRLDAAFGEWLTPDYFEHCAPPPDDNHRALSQSSRQWLDNHGSGHLVDNYWPLSELGNSGQYGETYDELRARFGSGVDNLIQVYGPPPHAKPPGSPMSQSSSHSRELVARSRSVSFSGSQTIVIVTHGAGCNALLGHLLKKPLLNNVALASYVALELSPSGNWVEASLEPVVDSPLASTSSETLHVSGSTKSVDHSLSKKPSFSSISTASTTTSPLVEKATISPLTSISTATSPSNATASASASNSTAANTATNIAPALSHSPGSSVGDEFAWPNLDSAASAINCGNTNDSDLHLGAPMMLSFSKKY